MLLALMASCTSGPTPTTTTGAAFTPAQLELVAGLWTNSIGLHRPDADLWQVRLTEMCDKGVWETNVAVDLAAKYVGEDEAFSVRAPAAGPVDMGEAANALWVMGVQVCVDRYPDGYEVVGPPFGPGSADSSRPESSNLTVVLQCGDKSLASETFDYTDEFTGYATAHGAVDTVKGRVGNAEPFEEVVDDSNVTFRWFDGDDLVGLLTVGRVDDGWFIDEWWFCS